MINLPSPDAATQDRCWDLDFLINAILPSGMHDCQLGCILLRIAVCRCTIRKRGCWDSSVGWGEWMVRILKEWRWVRYMTFCVRHALRLWAVAVVVERAEDLFGANVIAFYTALLHVAPTTGRVGCAVSALDVLLARGGNVRQFQLEYLDRLNEELFFGLKLFESWL